MLVICANHACNNLNLSLEVSLFVRALFDYNWCTGCLLCFRSKVEGNKKRDGRTKTMKHSGWVLQMSLPIACSNFSARFVFPLWWMWTWFCELPRWHKYILISPSLLGIVYSVECPLQCDLRVSTDIHKTVLETTTLCSGAFLCILIILLVLLTGTEILFGWDCYRSDEKFILAELHKTLFFMATFV